MGIPLLVGKTPLIGKSSAESIGVAGFIVLSTCSRAETRAHCDVPHAQRGVRRSGVRRSGARCSRRRQLVETQTCGDRPHASTLYRESEIRVILLQQNYIVLSTAPQYISVRYRRHKGPFLFRKPTPRQSHPHSADLEWMVLYFRGLPAIGFASSQILTQRRRGRRGFIMPTISAHLCASAFIGRHTDYRTTSLNTLTLW